MQQEEEKHHMYGDLSGLYAVNYWRY